MPDKVERYINSEISKKGGLLFSLIDPVDYKSPEDAVRAGAACGDGGADIILIGGSIGAQGELLDFVADGIKSKVSVPIVLFPGNIATITRHADALYFMSLLNSRNQYWISGAQALAAPLIKRMGIEALPVGYIVVEPGGTVGWVGDANLVPRNKPQIAAALALSAQLSGRRFVITDAGSNPKDGHIPLEMVSAVAKAIDVPYIVAGGVRTPEQAKNVIKAGADAIHVGTAFENVGEAELRKKVGAMVKAVREGAKERK
jgi:phosphoglycerol geranylgeranyltransferase